MSRPGHSNEQISFDYTVPSQEGEYMQARMAATHDHGPMRRKRSPSRDEDDDDEEVEDDDDYVPGGGGSTRGYAGQRFGGSGGGQMPYGADQRGGSFDMGSEDQMHPHGGILGSSSSAGRAGASRKAQGGSKQMEVGPDGQRPPKKKRRRQALSCTECKRRKIRCDRAQPCAPCTRRGEGDKCKWNILEPVEKFVTRKEYDEIKDSLTRLETILSTSTPGGPGSGATEEVAAAVNVVKSKAVLLGKVISNSGPQQGAHSTAFGDGSTSGPNALNSVAVSATASSSRGHTGSSGNLITTEGMVGANGMGLMSGHGGSGGSVATPFGYQSFSLSVPSQSPVGHGHGQGDEDYYGARQRSHSHSQPTPTSYSRGSLIPSPAPSHSIQHYPNQPISGHFSSLGSGVPSPTYHQPRVPQIDLGGLVVEDQSSNRMQRNDYSMNDTTSSLSTLATVANSSTRPMNLQPLQTNRSGDLHSPSLTLPPIGASSHSTSPTPGSATGRRELHSRNLNISMPPSDTTGTALPFVAPPRLPITDKAGRESELRRVLQAYLPRREVCDRLVEYYFTKVEWSITLLHKASFMRASQAFWFLSEDDRSKIISPTTPESATSWGNGFRASFLPPAMDYSTGYGRLPPKNIPRANAMRTPATTQEDHGVNPPWISLFFAVLCVSLERMGFYDAKALSIVDNVDDYKRQCRLLYDSSQAVMILGDFLSSRALETVQALVLHLHCQQAMTSTQWEAQTAVSLSVAARIGTMMGLNKLGAEKPGSARRPGLLKRELGRRAWWNLIERDWTLSPRVGHTYAINPIQNFCDLPANLDWEELELGQNAFVQQQREVWTGASSFLCRIELARLGRELTDRYNSVDGVTYGQLLKQEDLLRESISHGPPQLLEGGGDNQSDGGYKQWDHLHFTFHMNFTLITLHRPYLIASLLESRAHVTRKTGQGDGNTSSLPARYTPSYPKTVESSVRSAEAILDTLEESKASDHPGVQWWQTTIYYYTAAVVLLVERWYSDEAKPGSLESEDADEHRRKIVAAIALLREQGESIDLFAQAANALDSLLDATTSARRKSRKASSRRGMDINDVVNPVNISRNQVTDTPPFVRQWLDRPNTPLPTEAMLNHTPSLSTMALLPGVPLVADISYDSHFWARVFDFEFVDPPDMNAMFFPSEGMGNEDENGEGAQGDVMMGNSGMGTSGTGGAFPNTMMEGGPVWRSEGTDERNNSGEGTSSVGNHTGMGASAIWDAVSGPIGSMAAGDGWPRAAPYDHLK